MADLFDVCDIVTRMADGFESTVMQCIADNANIAADSVREQLMCGLDGEGMYLNPTYDNDPYFEEDGPWHNLGHAYKAWKREKTPPAQGSMLLLPARPDSIPNLFIDGTFHDSITATVQGDTLLVEAGSDGNAPDIVEKWGDKILRLGSVAVQHINDTYITPRIWDFFAECGYTSD